MTWLFVVLAIVVVAFAFLAALGFLGELPAAEPDLRPESRDGEPVFDVVVRGYRMDEVDQHIAALQTELEESRGREATSGAAASGPDAESDAAN